MERAAGRGCTGPKASNAWSAEVPVKEENTTRAHRNKVAGGGEQDGGLLLGTWRARHCEWVSRDVKKGS